MEDRRHKTQDSSLGRGSGASAGAVSGWAIVGWAAFFIILAGLLVFGYKVFIYYRQIKSGQLIELPQYSSSLTTADGQPVRSSSLAVEPSSLATEEDPTLGADAEKVATTVVMFGDFECAFSKDAATVFRRMAVEFGDRVRFVYRDYPMSSIHPRAFAAAAAAECAKEQMKYWEYFDKLYLNMPALDYQDLVAYAQEIGLDTNQFERCLSDGRYDARVNSDLIFAEGLKLRGTPTFFFDGRRVEGALPEDDFRQTLEKLLK